jgi:hypothetical protein
MLFRGQTLPERKFREQKLTRLIVRCAKSNKFLKATGRWTKKAEKALHFPNLLNAIHACLGGGLKDVVLVLRYEGEAYDHCYQFNAAQPALYQTWRPASEGI